MLILFVLLVTIGIVVYSFTILKRNNNTTHEEIKNPSTFQCCGTHSICEKESLIVTKEEIEYYDDEELDVYAEIDPTSYDEKALALFDEIFFSLTENDIPRWIKSLHLRRIELPENIKEQVLMILTEKRSN